MAIGLGFGLADPWHYRFFPFELALFIGGSLSCRHLLPFLESRFFTSARIISIICVTTFITIIMFPFIPLSVTAKHIGVLCVAPFVLPFLFLFQRFNNWDKKLGELSYPIYICHWFILGVVDRFIHKPLGHQKAFYTVIGSLLFSLALNKLMASVEARRVRLRVGSVLT
jgi:peptidoglycan/LPS O-acetylase OafA/YrhL